MATAERVTRVRIQVEGIVQGVGFRPFVHALATGGELAGLVGNDARGAFIEVEGAASAVSDFQRALRSQAPPLAVIDRVVTPALVVDHISNAATRVSKSCQIRAVGSAFSLFAIPTKHKK